MSLPDSRTIWEEGRVPGPEIAALAVALTVTSVGLDLLLTDEVTVLFDVMFVLGCLLLALAVRPNDFFTAGVLPPLLMLGAFVLVAIGRVNAVARPDDSLVQATISALSHHSLALMMGYGGCLGVLYLRQRVMAQRITRTGRRHRLPT